VEEEVPAAAKEDVDEKPEEKALIFYLFFKWKKTMLKTILFFQ
jgi:hypothetical protein